MNNILITITYLNGIQEEIECCDYTVRNEVLQICKRYESTICYPLCSILKYEVKESGRW